MLDKGIVGFLRFKFWLLLVVLGVLFGVRFAQKIDQNVPEDEGFESPEHHLSSSSGNLEIAYQSASKTTNPMSVFQKYNVTTTLQHALASVIYQT